MSPPEENDKAAAAIAAAAAADPDAVQAAVDKAKADADKAEADARSALAKAISDERDTAYKDTVLGRQQRDAEAQKATAEAKKATAAAQRDQVATFIPDLSKVDRGTLEVKGDQPLFASALAQCALDAAAMSLADKAKVALSQVDHWRVLVTSDGELATSHAAYIDVVTGLGQLSAAADKLIAEVSAAKMERAVPVGPAISALVGALPGLLSLFSAHRTITTTSVTINDLAATAAAAGALKRIENSGAVVHDDVRLLTTGAVHSKLAALSGKRQELVGHKIALEAEKTKASTDLADVKKEIEELEKKIESAKGAAQTKLRAELNKTQDRVGPLEQALSAATVKGGLIESVTSAIDSFVASLTAVPEGATRSPLALAAMREHLHDVADPPGTEADDPARFTHVLLVKGNGGSAQQTIDDRPLWFDDKFEVVATANITYILLETSGSEVLVAGNEGASAAGHGTIGDRFEVHVDTTSLE